MKKICYLIILIFFTACSIQNKTDASLNGTSSENAIETYQDTADADELKTQNDVVKELYLQNHYETFVNNVELLDGEYIYGEINPELSSHGVVYWYGFGPMDNKGNLCFVKTADYLRSDELHQIGYYNIFSDEITIIEEGENPSEGYGIEFINSDYIIYSKCYDYLNWRDYKRFIYNRKTFEKTEYHEPTKDSKGFAYARFSSPPCIFGNSIYFSDTYFIDENGDTYVDVLKYNISDGTTEIVDTQAKIPMLYKDGVAYVKQSDDKESVFINFISEDGTISTIMDISDKEYNRIYCSGNVITFSYPMYENDLHEETTGYEGMVGSGVGFFDSDGNEVKIMEGAERACYIDELVFYNNIGILYFLEETYPMYYNIDSNTLYILKDSNPARYGAIVCDSFILFIYSDEGDSGTNQKYIIKYLD